ncbi:DUF2190 family protein [Streptomyces europaeiscabiei]|uniref:DUF2190 family protein n=1 Tax=Streptomyces europaeiscabiei TaxID=146819 RepID=UPI000A8DB6BC|nr:DUF2190 family protein [Streptomyces europaeiscabiei]
MSKFAIDSNHMSFPAGADLTGKRYYGVKLDSNRAVVLCAADTDECIGVLNTEGVAGEMVSVRVRNARGSGRVKLGGTVNTLMARLTWDANGKAIAAASGDAYFGRAIVTGVANDEVEYISECGLIA